MTKKAHWFLSPAGHFFYVIKTAGKWRFTGPHTYIINDASSIGAMKTYITEIFGFDYLGYM